MSALDRSLSPERWRTYQLASGFRDELAMQLYLWNAALGQSFHFPLQAVEVALRNVIHAALMAEHGAEWCLDEACRAMLNPKQRNAIDKALQRHLKKYGADATTAQIVASQTFGFWTALLRREYDRPIWDAHAMRAFPHLVGTTFTIGAVSDTAIIVQDLRNRIFHHEPLIGHNLLGDYSAIMRLLGWICPVTRNWVKKYSSVPVVIRQRPAAT